MKYQLNVAERVGLLNILPPEGNFVTLRIIRELQTALSFSEEEVKRFGMKTNPAPGGLGAFVTWEPEHAAEMKEIEIGDIAHDAIAEQLRTLETHKKLRMEMLELYTKFVEKPSQPPQT